MKPFLIFLLIVLFFASLSTILLELALTRVFSIVLWYDYAFMAISVAFFGLGIGSLVIHMQKDSANWNSKYERKEQLSSRIIYFAIAYAISIPAFVLLISAIPPSTSNVNLFYLVSSVPFFFAGSIMALVFYAMPQNISKLYFADLIGAASATLLLDPLMRGLGAEYVILLTAPMVAGSAIAGALALTRSVPSGIAVTGRLKMLAGIVLAGTLLVPIVGNVSAFDALEVRPGNNKGLYYQLKQPERFEHLSEEWNSFSRIDVTRETKVNSTMNNYDSVEDSKELAAIIIDADAGTPIFRWDGSQSDLVWLHKYMDYLPYEMKKVDSTLVIGGGGGEDILTAIAGGSKKVTAVELNPLIVSAAKRYGSESGNLYERDNVNLFIDDGRRFISSTDEKYDAIVIKLVDSWAAQLAGGYALSENYLYTTEAIQQYLRHLDKDGGMLVMIRWNFELPRLMPLVADSLMKETGKSREDISQNVMVVEDRPGLFFGRNEDKQTIYPVLVVVKTTPFSDDQIDLAREKAEKSRADVIMLPDGYMRPPYDKLFSSDGYNDYFSQVSNPKIPTDDSPFYFAKEPVPQQMIVLLETVLGISAALSVLLVWNAKKKKARMDAMSGFHLLFAVFIGLGFMILEITFIQKFLLLLGTPIMALTVILFSILLSSGIGAYLSGRLFGGRPYRAVFVSAPALAGVILFHLFFLQVIIDSSITMELPPRAALTIALLFPAGLLMGFQFPSLISMASLAKNRGDNTTLLWGVNVVASIIGTVFAATLAMIVGFSGNLLIGIGAYSGAAASALLALLTIKRAQVAVMGDRQ